MMENLGISNNKSESNHGYRVFLKDLLSKISPRFSFETKKINSIEAPEELKNNPEFIKEKNALFTSYFKNKAKLILKISSLAYLIYLGIEYKTQLPPGKYKDRERAKIDLANDGITKEQASAYKWGTSDLLYNTIGPEYYPTPDHLGQIIEQIPSNVWTGREDDSTHKMMKPSEDAWAMYLGLPQKYGTFDISDDKPIKSSQDMYYYKIKDEDAVANMLSQAAMHFIPELEKRYLEIKDTLDVNNILDNNIKLMHELSTGDFKKYKSWKINEYQKHLSQSKGSDVVRVKGTEGHMLENFTVSGGSDEKGDYISLYDVWDFNFASEQLSKTYGGLGRPFEIYQRLYIDPDGNFIMNTSDKK